MYLYVDAENKVRDVDSTKDTTLEKVFVDENDETFPFKGWSSAKICCFKVTVSDGLVLGYSPYVDTRSLDMIDTLGKYIDEAKESSEKIAATLDSLFTDILPELMG